MNSNAVREPGEFPAFLLIFSLCTDTEVKCDTIVIFFNTFGMTKNMKLSNKAIDNNTKISEQDITIQHTGLVEQ